MGNLTDERQKTGIADDANSGLVAAVFFATAILIGALVLSGGEFDWDVVPIAFIAWLLGASLLSLLTVSLKPDGDLLSDADSKLVVVVFAATAVIVGALVLPNGQTDAVGVLAGFILWLMGASLLSLVILWLKSDSDTHRSTGTDAPPHRETPGLKRPSSANQADLHMPGWAYWILINLILILVLFMVKHGLYSVGLLAFFSFGLVRHTTRYLDYPPNCPIRPQSLWWLRFFAFFVPIIGLALTVVYLTRPSEAEQHMGLGFLTLWLWGLVLEVAAYLLLM